MENKVWDLVTQRSLRLSRTGSIPSTRAGISKCYRMHVKKVTPGIYVLHVWAFHHTCTDTLGPHASFVGFRRSGGHLLRNPASEGLNVGPTLYPYSFLRTRLHQCTFSLV